jgi:hypothetical protein
VRRAARVDSNHQIVLGAFIACGCEAESTAAMGKGFPDIKEAARASARAFQRTCPPCTGDCSQGRSCNAPSNQRTVYFPDAPASWFEQQAFKPVQQAATAIIDFSKCQWCGGEPHPNAVCAFDEHGERVCQQPHRVVPLTQERYDELTQRPMPWTGLTIAAAIVLACAAVALLVHAAGVHGWLR